MCQKCGMYCSCCCRYRKLRGALATAGCLVLELSVYILLAAFGFCLGALIAMI